MATTLTYNEDDIVILTKKEYNELMKEIRNYRYLEKIKNTPNYYGLFAKHLA